MKIINKILIVSILILLCSLSINIYLHNLMSNICYDEVCIDSIYDIKKPIILFIPIIGYIFGIFGLVLYYNDCKK